MPIIRKLIQVGTSKAITIPKSWLEYFKIHEGIEITEVAVEINKILKIMPILPKRQNPKWGEESGDGNT